MTIYFGSGRYNFGEGNGTPLQYSYLENPMDGGAWWAAVHGVVTEQLHFHFSLSCIGGGNGNPFQCSCLENPRDRGAWSLRDIPLTAESPLCELADTFAGLIPLRLPLLGGCERDQHLSNQETTDRSAAGLF